MKHFATLQRKIKKNKDANPDIIKKAYVFARDAHEDQQRMSGEAYIIHPVAVAEILYDMGASDEMVCPGLLHDVIEDCKHIEGIEKKIHQTFGNEIYYLVESLSKEKTGNPIFQQKEYILKLKQAIEMDASIFFIKVADLIHNLDTLTFLTPEKQKVWIHELKYEYLPVFSDFLHYVPLHYKEMFHKMMERLKEDIKKYDI